MMTDANHTTVISRTNGRDLRLFKEKLVVLLVSSKNIYKDITNNARPSPPINGVAEFQNNSENTVPCSIVRIESRAANLKVLNLSSSNAPITQNENAKSNALSNELGTRVNDTIRQISKLWIILAVSSESQAIIELSIN